MRSRSSRARTCPTRLPQPTAPAPNMAPDYIIPVPFDPRLISYVPPAIAKAAMDTGVARRPIVDMDAYRAQLRSRRDPVAGFLQRVLRAAAPPAAARGLRRRRGGAGHPRRDELRRAGAGNGASRRPRGARARNARTISASTSAAASRSSMPGCRSETQPMPPISTSGSSARAFCRATVSGSSTRIATISLPAWWRSDDADAMVTGVTRNFSVALADIRRCIDPKPGHRVMGVSLVLARGRTVLVADTAVTEMPNAESLADIAVEAAGVARRFGYEPRLALLAFSTFGHPPGERAAQVQAAVRILDQRRVDFEYDGDMAADVALNMELREVYPFCRLSGPANVLIMPAFHSASISTKLLRSWAAPPSSVRSWSGSTGRCRSCRSRPTTPSSSTWRRSRRSM